MFPLFEKIPSLGYFAAAASSALSIGAIVELATPIISLILLIIAVPTSILTLLIQYKNWKKKK